MIFYHGSPTPNLEILEPRLDPRPEINGIFVANEPYGPMMFSLLPSRATSTVNYETKSGKFIKGNVVTREINNEGWLYTVEADSGIVQERKSGRYHLTAPVKIIKVEKVTKKDVLKLGWKIEFKN